MCGQERTEQKKLDVITNDMLTDAAEGLRLVAASASEELDLIEPTGRVRRLSGHLRSAGRLVNIDVNVPVGTIFSILPAPAGRAPAEADFLIRAAAGRGRLCRLRRRRPCWS
jgi:fructose-1,6-bisphosphatase I